MCIRDRYSPYGELVSETDENGHTIKFDYDGTGNLKKVQNALDLSLIHI